MKIRKFFLSYHCQDEFTFKQYKFQSKPPGVILLLDYHEFGNTGSIGIPSEVYYKVDRLLTGINAQQIGATARWYSNKTPLSPLGKNDIDFLIHTSLEGGMEENFKTDFLDYTSMKPNTVSGSLFHLQCL